MAGLEPEAAEADADPDEDGASNYLEYLTRGDPLQGGDLWTIRITRDEEAVRL